MKKKILIALLAVVLVLAIALGGVGMYMVSFGITRKEGMHDVAPESGVAAEDSSVITENYAAITVEMEKWLENAVIEDKTVVSDDGLTLLGEVYWTDPDSHLWLLGIHGYTSKKEDYRNIGSKFAEKGYNLLLPDMRAHGESEGKYIGMGWLDRRDVLKWIDLIIEMDPEAQIILHGTSMGGATVMMTAGEALPQNVKGIIEDCGYTSVWDIFRDELKYLFGLPPFPVLHAASVVSKLQAGYFFSEGSAVKQLEKATVPMLFIHGGNDTFVRTDMVYEVYEACPTVKELLVIEGAGHGEAYAMDPELYFDTVFGFIEENCIE